MWSVYSQINSWSQQEPLLSQHMENIEAHIFSQIFSRRIKCMKFDQLAKEPSYWYIETKPIKFLLDQFGWFIPWRLWVCERSPVTHLAGGATGITRPLVWMKTMLLQTMVWIQPQMQEPFTGNNALPVGKLEWSVCTTKNPLAASVTLCFTTCVFSSRAVAGF